MEESKDWKALAIESQMQFFETLGSRPYDEIEKTNLFLLKKKIGFATCGKPKDLPSSKNYNTGYDPESLKHIKLICEKVIEKSDSDPIRFACTILMLHYKGGICDTPVFRIVTDNGSVFIDAQSRVYSSWTSFMENNKLPDCEYCFPVNGEYYANKVEVGFAYSPANSLFSKTMDCLDTAGSIASLAAAGVFAAGLMITVAPAAIAAAGTTAACTGVYGISRSVGTLLDRNKHEQSVGLEDREARSAWFTIGSSAVGVATFKAVNHAKKIVEGGESLTKLGVFGLHALNASSLVFSGFGFVESLLICVDKYQKGSLTNKDVFDLSCELLFLFNAIASAKATSNLVNTMNATVAETPSVQKKLTKTQKRNLKRRAAKRRARGQIQPTDPSGPTQDNSSGIRNAVQMLILEAIAVYAPRLEEIRYACQSIGHDIKCWKSKEISKVDLLNNLARKLFQLYSSYRDEITEALTKIVKYFTSLNIGKILEDILSLFANATEELKKMFCTKVINMEDEVDALITEAEREVTDCHENLGIEFSNNSSDSSIDDNSDDSDLTPEAQRLLSRCGDVIAKASLSCNELKDFEAILEEVKYHLVATFKEKISNYKKSLEAAKSASRESFSIEIFHNALGIQGDVGQSMFDSTLEELTNASVIYKIKTKLIQRICNPDETAMCTAVWESVTEGVFNCFGPHEGGELSEAQILSLVSKILKLPLSTENCNVMRKGNMFMVEVSGKSESDEKTVIAYQEISAENTASVMIYIVNSE